MIPVYTFYYDRYNSATTSRSLCEIPHKVVFHSQEQYTQFNPSILCGETLITDYHKGLSGQRNEVLKTLENGQWVIFCSDDYVETKSVPRKYLHGDVTSADDVDNFDYYILKNEVSTLSLYNETLRLINIAEAEGINLVGFASNGNPFYLKKKYRYSGLVDGRWFAMKKTDILFDENVQTMDDHDISAAHLSRGQKVLVNNWMIPNFERYKVGGYGTMLQRLERKKQDCQYLIEKYPDIFYYSDKKGQPPLTHLKFK